MTGTPYFKASASQILLQAHAAHKWIEEETQRLVDEGWIWHMDIQMWLHPDRPGESISY